MMSHLNINHAVISVVGEKNATSKQINNNTGSLLQGETGIDVRLLWMFPG